MKEKLGLTVLLIIYIFSFVYRGHDPLGREDYADVMEGAFFQGGYGMEWLYDAGRELEQAHPGVKAHVWGNPRVWNQTRPRFIAGKPPDAFWDIHDIDIWANLADGLVASLDSVMNAPAYGQEGVIFRETFFAGALEPGQSDGHQYFLPISYAVEGIWYNVNLFEKHSWKLPETWDEFLTLCETIKRETGIAPLTHQGRYPSYYLMITRALLYKLGGQELLVDLDNLVPGAWERPEVVTAARMSKDLTDHGYVLEGSSAFTHTEAQMVWLQGRATMIPCGTWLENEMRESIPPGFRMRIMPIPGISDGKGGVRAVEAATDAALWVPAQARRLDLGMEYLRILLSRKMAQNFVRKVGDIMPIKGCTEGVPIPESLESALAAIDSAKGETFRMMYTVWYHEMTDAIEDAMAAMLYEGISPEEFAHRAEMAADRIRKDDRIRKYTRRSPSL
jgi:N-acetylglucosamine transport system substrate-binding protein